MDSQGAAAKHKERIALEEKLGKYQHQVLYAQSVLIWDRPAHFFLLIIATNWVIRFLFRTEASILSLVGLTGLAFFGWLLADRFLNIKWPASLSAVVPPGNSDRTRRLSLRDVIAKFVDIRFYITDFAARQHEKKQKEPVSFILQSMLFFFILLVVGSYISTKGFVYLVVNALLLTPGIVANGWHTRAIDYLRPYFAQFVGLGKVKALEVYALVIAQAKHLQKVASQQMAKKQARPAAKKPRAKTPEPPVSRADEVAEEKPQEEENADPKPAEEKKND